MTWDINQMLSILFVVDVTKYVYRKKQQKVKRENGEEARSEATHLFFPLLSLSGLEFLLHFLDQTEGGVEVGGGGWNLPWLLGVGTAIRAEHHTHNPLLFTETIKNQTNEIHTYHGAFYQVLLPEPFHKKFIWFQESKAMDLYLLTHVALQIRFVPICLEELSCCPQAKPTALIRQVGINMDKK